MLTPALIAAVVAFAWLQEHRNASPAGVPNATLVGAAFAVIVGAVIFSFSNWRCPSCHRYLGKVIHPGFCPACGIPLR